MTIQIFGQEKEAKIEEEKDLKNIVVFIEIYIYFFC